MITFELTNSLISHRMPIRHLGGEISSIDEERVKVEVGDEAAVGVMEFMEEKQLDYRVIE